jgi:hypothetical protein
MKRGGKHDRSSGRKAFPIVETPRKFSTGALGCEDMAIIFTGFGEAFPLRVRTDLDQGAKRSTRQSFFNVTMCHALESAYRLDYHARLKL